MAAAHSGHRGAGVRGQSLLRRSAAFGLAMSLSLSVHAVALVLLPNSSDDGGTQFGQGGIMLSLGASGGPAGNAAPASESASATEVMSEEADVISADAQEAEVRDFAEPVEDLPVVQPDAVQAADASEVVEAAEVPEAARPVEAAAVAVAALALPAETVEAADAVAPPLPRRRPPVAKHDQRTARTVEAATDVTLQKVEPETAKNQEALLQTISDDVDRQQDRNATAAESSPDRAKGLQANLTEGQDGIYGLSGPGHAGQGSDRPDSGAPGAESDYFQELSRWLEKHKRYPRRSKLRNEQGVVQLRLVVTQSGDVSAFKIVESSGYQRLDKEVADMIDRAKPLPAIPDALQQTSISVLLPVGFLLR